MDAQTLTNLNSVHGGVGWTFDPVDLDGWEWDPVVFDFDFDPAVFEFDLTVEDLLPEEPV